MDLRPGSSSTSPKMCSPPWQSARTSRRRPRLRACSTGTTASRPGGPCLTAPRPNHSSRWQAGSAAPGRSRRRSAPTSTICSRRSACQPRQTLARRLAACCRRTIRRAGPTWASRSVGAAEDHALAVCRPAIASHARAVLSHAVQGNAARCGGSLGFDVVLACWVAAMERQRPAGRDSLLESWPVINDDGVRIAEGGRSLQQELLIVSEHGGERRCCAGELDRRLTFAAEALCCDCCPGC